MKSHHVPTYELIVNAAANGIRIDSFLSRCFRNYTTWKLQRLVVAGAVLIDSVPADPTVRVFAGQHVRVRLIEPPDKLLDPERLDLSVIYEDPWLMVINKPAGIIAHPVGMIQSGTLCNGVQHLLDQRSELKGILRPGIVHRLDRQTSGAIVVALTHDAHVGLSNAFESSRVAKTYLALVEGVIAKDEGTIDQAIGRSPIGRHVLMSCRPDAIDKKRSKTHFRVIERFSHHTLVLARPMTGRNHQIRVHLAHIGHPLVGDEFYQAHGKFKPFRTDFDPETYHAEIETGLPIRRHALHACHLEFTHPIGGAWLSFDAQIPKDFSETLNELRHVTGQTQQTPT